MSFSLSALMDTSAFKYSEKTDNHKFPGNFARKLYLLHVNPPRSHSLKSAINRPARISAKGARIITGERICIRQSVTCTFLGGKRGVENHVIAIEEVSRWKVPRDCFHGRRCRFFNFFFHAVTSKKRERNRREQLNDDVENKSDLYDIVLRTKFFGVPRTLSRPLLLLVSGLAVARRCPSNVWKIIMIPVWQNASHRTEVNGTYSIPSQEFVYSVSGFYVGNGCFFWRWLGCFYQ